MGLAARLLVASGLVAVLCMAMANAQTAQPAAVWTTQDVLDTRIDVAAQYGLMRMLAGEPEERIAGSNILGAVKDGSLGGIYQEDQKVPALRAQASGYGWWQILPKVATGQKADSKCMTDPAGKPPILVMRKKAEANPAAYDRALQEAWSACGLVPGPVRPYDKTLPDKQPVAKQQRCAEAQGATTLAVTVLAPRDEAGQRKAAPGVQVQVSAPDGGQRSAATDGGGTAHFVLPGGGIHLLQVHGAPLGFRDLARTADLLGGCRNHALFEFPPLGLPHCEFIRASAPGQCFSMATIKVQAKCQQAFARAIGDCAQLPPPQNVTCTTTLHQVLRNCMIGPVESQGQCQQEFVKKAGC